MYQDCKDTPVHSCENCQFGCKGYDNNPETCEDWFPIPDDRPYYNCDNMAGFLGNMATDAQAEKFADYLLAQGWELEFPRGCEYLEAYRNDEEMTEEELDCALDAVFG